MGTHASSCLSLCSPKLQIITCAGACPVLCPQDYESESPVGNAWIWMWSAAQEGKVSSTLRLHDSLNFPTNEWHFLFNPLLYHQPHQSQHHLHMDVFFPRYNRHRTFYQFQVCNIMIPYLYILWNDHQSKSSLCPQIARPPKRREKSNWTSPQRHKNPSNLARYGCGGPYLGHSFNLYTQRYKLCEHLVFLLLEEKDIRSHLYHCYHGY